VRLQATGAAAKAAGDLNQVMPLFGRACLAMVPIQTLTVGNAREHQITRIVIGSIQSTWWHIADGGPLLRRVIHEAGASGIDVHIIAHRELPPDVAPESSAAKES
jgi:K+-sensing histidine kinase KdpD